MIKSKEVVTAVKAYMAYHVDRAKTTSHRVGDGRGGAGAGRGGAKEREKENPP